MSKSITFIAGCVLFCVVGQVGATPIVIPQTLATVEGNSANQAPFTAERRFQTVYGSSMLPFSVGDTITSISFRADSSVVTPLSAQTVSSFEIRLSQSANSPGSLSATFASNRGGDEVIARTGSLTINAGDYTAGGSPNAFGPTISLTSPYTYAGGDLLLEIATSGPTTGSMLIDNVSPTTFPSQSAYASNFGATVADIGSFIDTPIVAFEVIPIPEPCTFLLVAFSLLSLSFSAWRGPGVAIG